MQFKTITNQKLPFFVALGLFVVLTSCGSYQYAGHDNDGIYSSNEEYEEKDEPVITTSTNGSNYYKNYFAENKAEVDAITSEGEIFTDIDSYEGNYNKKAQDSLEQRQVYGGWGQNNNAVTINVIDNGWYGWNSPWFYNTGWGYGYGYNNWAWGRPWGYGGYGYGWNNPWAYGYGGYYGYGWNLGFGYGGGYYGWNNGYYRNTNRYAFHSGRRGSLLSNNNLSRIGRSNSALSRRNYSTTRLSNSNGVTRRNSSIRSNRSSSSRVTRPSRTIRRNSSTTTRRGTTVPRATRSTRSTRSSGTVRRSSSSRSSGGTVRSSGSSSRRSSGGSRSSSRRGGGR